MIQAAEMTMRNFNPNGRTTLSFLIFLSASFLVTLGDLRNIILPIGYWSAWGVIAICALIHGWGNLKQLLRSRVLLACGFGFVLLVSGCLIAGFIRGDNYTLYQGLKYVCILFVFISVYSSSCFLTKAHISQICAWSILLGGVAFVVAKYILNDSYIRFGDGREGSILAAPGVLWRAPVLFCGFIIAKIIEERRIDWKDPVILGVAIFQLAADSSRTGLILIIGIVTILLLYSYLRRNLQRYCAGLLLMLYAGVGIAYFFVRTSYHATTPLVLNRITQGDPLRIQLLLDGIANAKNCFPLGCGFSSSATLVVGKPMVVHNAYVAAFADLGVIAFFGLAIMMLAPIAFYVWNAVRLHLRGDSVSYYSLGAASGVAAFAFIFMFHALSSELSEWGFWILMVSWLSVLSASDNNVGKQNASSRHS